MAIAISTNLQYVLLDKTTVRSQHTAFMKTKCFVYITEHPSRQLVSLGTIKASQIVVPNEDMLLLLNKNSYK